MHESLFPTAVVFGFSLGFLEITHAKLRRGNKKGSVKVEWSEDFCTSRGMNIFEAPFDLKS